MTKCLKNFKKHPFNLEKLEYRTISSKVKVLGIGNDIIDDTFTETPELVLVKPSINVLSNTKYQLLNANGWYCFKSKVNVLGKANVDLHCNAQLTVASNEVTVLGSDGGKENGITILGKTSTKKVKCDKNKKI